MLQILQYAVNPAGFPQIHRLDGIRASGVVSVLRTSVTWGCPKGCGWGLSGVPGEKDIQRQTRLDPHRADYETISKLSLVLTVPFDKLRVSGMQFWPAHG